MSTNFELQSALREIAGGDLLQEAPYPVVAPSSVELAAQLIRVARDFRQAVMVLGSGSSFPADFHVLRENILAVMTIRLTGVQSLSPFAVRVLSGTPVAAVMRSAMHPARRTLGGLIGDHRGLGGDPVLRALWPQVKALEVLTPAGDIRRYISASAGGWDDAGTADLFIGSRGRLGLITAVELGVPVPYEPAEPDGDRRTSFEAAVSEPALTLRDVQPLVDPDGLFQWS